MPEPELKSASDPEAAPAQPAASQPVTGGEVNPIEPIPALSVAIPAPLIRHDDACAAVESNR
jgi:hypothetical protein